MARGGLRQDANSDFPPHLFHPGLPVSVKGLSTCWMCSLGALLASFAHIPGPTGCPWGIYLESDHFSQPIAPPPQAELAALTMVTALTSLLPTPNNFKIGNIL